MAVSIRFSRIGKKNRPYWRIVVVDSRKKRDGAYLDNLGTYDPLKHVVIQFEKERLQEWVGKGAQCSPAITKMIKAHTA
ncbi:MAG: 30S ribosomal protein S16 [Candidatus Babeliales bacterium]|jgi:small subunit ribosomal protein S16